MLIFWGRTDAVKATCRGELYRVLWLRPVASCLKIAGLKSGGEMSFQQRVGGVPVHVPVDGPKRAPPPNKMRKGLHACFLSSEHREMVVFPVSLP